MCPLSLHSRLHDHQATVYQFNRLDSTDMATATVIGGGQWAVDVARDSAGTRLSKIGFLLETM